MPNRYTTAPLPSKPGVFFVLDTETGEGAPFLAPDPVEVAAGLNGHSESLWDAVPRELFEWWPADLVTAALALPAAEEALRA